MEKTGERIAKKIARAGVCSRRNAEKLIEEGKVKVNGETIKSPALNVSDSDIVMVNNKPLPAKQVSRMWKLHKPSGVITTNSDPEGRKTVFDILPENFPRVVSVGRLDMNTEGLLILTNDGELARHMELPSTGWTRRYRVRVHGRVDEQKLADLEKGVKIDGVKYAPAVVKVEKKQNTNTWLSVAIKEGKNREIRKIMEHLGLQVTRLIRVSYGPFMLGKLPRGKTAEIPEKIIKEQLGSFYSKKQ